MLASVTAEADASSFYEFLDGYVDRFSHNYSSLIKIKSRSLPTGIERLN